MISSPFLGQGRGVREMVEMVYQRPARPHPIYEETLSKGPSKSTLVPAWCESSRGHGYSQAPPVSLRTPTNRTGSPTPIPRVSASPALISKACAAGGAAVYLGRSALGVPGAGAATLGVISTTVQSRDIQTRSSGNCICFIQMLGADPDVPMNSMPLRGLRLSRPDRPFRRSSRVRATSSVNSTSPIMSVGPSP